jgi:CheY-like chemotaxis protein
MGPNASAARASAERRLRATAVKTSSAPERTALAVDIDPPFQPVLAAWLGARAYRVRFLALAAALAAAPDTALVVCELAEPKHGGGHALRQLAAAHPDAPLIALSARFVAGARRDTLARQVGAQAAVAKPCSRYDFETALDAALAMPRTARPVPDDPQGPEPARLRR